MAVERVVVWLKTASLIVIAFGLLTALAAWPALNLPTVWLVDLMFWPFDGAQNLAAPESRILSAILGGLLVGLGVQQYLIAKKLLPHQPKLACQILSISMWSWFIVDCLASIVAGAPFNVVMNVPFLLMFIVPLKLLKEVP